MLAEVVIVNLTQIDLVSQATLLHGVVAIVITQVKDDFYHDCFPINMFIPLSIKVFEYLP